MKKLIVFMLCAVVVFSNAFSLSASAESFDIGRHGSITVHYTDGTEGFEGLEIRAYRVAALHSNGAYGLIVPFSAYAVNVNNIRSQSEWKNAANTLASYIIADNIIPYCLMGTDENGVVIMENMETGLYLILAVNAERDGTVYSFENFFVVLPRPEQNSWDYDVEAIPKKDLYSGYLEYSVVKLWKDNGYEDKRTQEVAVDIYRDGILQETQILCSENNWSYKWRDADGKGVWTVAEKDVPQGYSVVITQKENVFDVVNTYSPPEEEEKDPTEPPDDEDEDRDTPEPPSTGDTPIAMRYYILMCVSGLAIIIIGICLGRKKE